MVIYHSSLRTDLGLVAISFLYGSDSATVLTQELGFFVDKDGVKKIATALILLIWVIVGFVLVTPIVGSHTIQWNAADLKSLFQIDTQNDQLARSSEDQWAMFHVIEKGCKCSEAVSRYLLERGPKRDIQEFVGIIGEDPTWEQQLSRKGFRVQTLKREDLKDLEGAPILQILDPQGNSVYVGGYGKHFIRSSQDVMDMKILAHLKDGAPVSEFPIYGCATSAKLKSIFDPFKIKSRNITSENL